MKSRKYSAVVSSILASIAALVGAILCPDEYRWVAAFILCIIAMLDGIRTKLNDLIEEIQNLQKYTEEENS